MSSTLLAPDTHIGAGLRLGKPGIGAIPNSRILDQLDLLDWILQQAIQHNAERIIITGDVFDDPKPSPTLIAYFVAWLKKCEMHDISVHIIQGNHDILRTGTTNTSSLDVIIESDIPNVSVYKDITTIFANDTAFTMVPFRDRKSFNLNSNAEAVERIGLNITYEVASIPTHYRKVLVGHLAIEGSIFIGDEVDDIANELFCPLSMFQGYDYVWMGHVHKPQVLQSKTPYRPLVAHIGSMDISNFGETEEKKHIVIIDDDKAFNIAIPTRPLKRIAVSVPENTKDSTAYVLAKVAELGDLSRAIVRLEIQLMAPDILPIDRNLIEKTLYGNGVFHIANITESKKPTPIKKDTNPLNTTMEIPSTIKTWITARVPQDKQDAVLSLAMDCYRQYREDQ